MLAGHAHRGLLLAAIGLGVVLAAGTAALGARAWSDAVDAALDRPLVLAYEAQEWETTPRELGASAAPRRLFEVAGQAFPPRPDTARAAWSLAEQGPEAWLPLSAPDERIAAAVAEVAGEIDREPRSAAFVGSGAELEVAAGTSGRAVAQDVAVERVQSALRERAGAVALPVEESEPSLTTAAAAEMLPAVQAAVAERLDQPVTVTAGDEAWEVRPRDVGAEPDLDAVTQHVRTAGEGAEPGAEDVPVTVAPDAVAERAAAIADELDRPARDAQLDWSSGWIEVTDERTGLSVDREALTAELHAALEDGTEAVEPHVERTQPAVTADAYSKVLLVRQNERRLYLYVDGEIAREWPVAVGAPDSPTPKGVFEVGAKRHSPTWNNPAPDGWGSDMPKTVGPGYDNPLGLRAINWNRGGVDTLIRLHGTAEVSSIGQAASRGCVRLTNDDVVELYDLVPSGTTIVSVAG